MLSDIYKWTYSRALLDKYDHISWLMQTDNTLYWYLLNELVLRLCWISMIIYHDQCKLIIQYPGIYEEHVLGLCWISMTYTSCRVWILMVMNSLETRTECGGKPGMLYLDKMLKGTVTQNRYIIGEWNKTYFLNLGHYYHLP